jgi:hypothetical protein
MESQIAIAQQDLEIPEREREEGRNVSPAPAIPTGGSCDTNPNLLLKDSTGARVTNLQKSLAKLNFDPGPIDGIFGPKTESAVKQFQETNRLVVDGIVGPNTQRALCSALVNPEVQSGFGEFLGTGEAIEPPPNPVPQDIEAEEENEANPEQAEREKNEANSDNVDFLASIEDKNILEPPFDDSFKIGSSPHFNSSLGTGSNVTSSSTPISLAPGAGTSSLTSATFEGINENVARAFPPDVSLAVGVRRAIEMVNNGYQVFDKVGDQILPDKFFTLNQLFRVGAPDPGDPNIVFDPSSKRFFASAMDLASRSVRIAVSDPDVAATTSLDPPRWKLFNFNIGNCPDQPWITVSSDKVAVSVNTHVKISDVKCSGTFLGTQTLLINKNDLINAVQNPAFKVTPTVTATKPKLDSFRDVPVRTFGTDEKIILVSIQKDANGFNKNAVKMKTISGPIKANIPLPASAISTKIIPFLHPGPPKPSPDGIQPGTNKCVSKTQQKVCIDTGFLQVSSASMSSDNRFMWLAFHESCKNPAAPPARKVISCIRLVEIDTNSGQIGSPKAVMTQDFNIVKRNMDFYYPTVTFDGSKTLGTNIMIVGFGGSNSTVFPSLFAFGQKVSGTSTPIIELKRGGGVNILGPATPPDKPTARYGDYFGSAIDPTDSSIRWIAGEYMQAAPASGPNPLWSSAISRVTFASPLPGAAFTGTASDISTGINASEAISSGLSCSDGTEPDIITGLCADGTQPQPLDATSSMDQQQPFNATSSMDQQQPFNATSSMDQQQQQLVCSDGTEPDIITGLCADGTQPQPLDATSSMDQQQQQQQQLVCSDGTEPDIITGLCADGTQPQPLDATTTFPQDTTEQLPLVCSDGSQPDSLTGLCADGSQP